MKKVNRITNRRDAEHDGAIILLHVGIRSSANALPAIIANLRDGVFISSRSRSFRNENLVNVTRRGTTRTCSEHFGSDRLLGLFTGRSKVCGSIRQGGWGTHHPPARR